MGWWPWSRGEEDRGDPAAADRAVEEALDLLDDDDVDGARDVLEAALRDHPGQGQVALELVDLVLDEDADDAPQEARALIERHRAALGRLEGERAARAIALEAEVWDLLGEPARALALDEQGLLRFPGDPWLLAGRGQRRFQLARFDEARADLERAHAGLPENDPAVLYTLACIAERDGVMARADELFARAESLDPDGFPRPVRLSKRAYDRAVTEALADLPAEIARAITNVIVVTEDLPDAEMLRQTGHAPDICGLYDGAPVGEQVSTDRVLPGRITLYKRNIEKTAADADGVRDEVRTTVLHEVGHHLGYDEDGLDRIGLA